MKAELFETLRLTQPSALPLDVPRDEYGYLNYNYLLSNGGAYKAGNVQRPMFWHKETALCCPAFYLHSNPLKTDRGVKPWTDVLLPDVGLVYYNGDNKTPGIGAAGGHNSGNKKLEQLWADYFAHEQEIRDKATPIFVFEHVAVGSKAKGYRKFVGFGIVTQVEVRQEYDAASKKVFSNYLFEISLFKVPPEGIDWRWVYDRRDASLALDEINRLAPASWKRWVREGAACLESISQQINHFEVSAPKEQISELEPVHKKILDAVVAHYPKSRDKGRFESLAALVTAEYFGDNYQKGWITKHSGDMGVDFVGRLNIRNHFAPSPPGTVLGQTKLMVLGQAKCRTNYSNAEELARDISRIAARLHRGHIGVYVSTGTFKVSTQKEVSIDKYPIVLINGRQLADLINQYMNRTGLTIQQVLTDADDWFVGNRRSFPPESILMETGW